MKNIDEFVALSTYTRRMLEQENIDCNYMPNGVQLYKSSKITITGPVLLYAGRLEIYKGVGDLLQAMPTILKQFPNARLEIAGNGSYKDELLRKVALLGIGKSVAFLGQLNQKELEKAYRRCSIFILPSRWPETFGKVGVEAMSVGRPVIATNVGGVSDWLHHDSNGYLIKPESPEDISRYALRILTDKKLAKRLSISARETSQHFSIEEMVNNIERLVSR